MSIEKKPLVNDLYTADPSAHVFNGKIYIYPSHDEDIDVVASVVEGYKGRHINLEKCEKIASDLGAKFRVREWIPNGYS